MVDASRTKVYTSGTGAAPVTHFGGLNTDTFVFPSAKTKIIS